MIDNIMGESTLKYSIFNILTNQNVLGNGIDIPLLGYREASREVLGEVHELFNDESYGISQCFLLSTSQVTDKICDKSVLVIAQINKFNKFALNVNAQKHRKLFLLIKLPCMNHIFTLNCTGGTGLISFFMLSSLTILTH